MRPHFYFKNLQEGLAEYRQRPGGGGPQNESTEEPNYELMANQFEQSKQRFLQNQTLRHLKRSLEIPVHFDLIEIKFQGCFDQQNYEQAYYNDFGFSLVHLSRFNRCGLFIIHDVNKLDDFMHDVDIFVSNARNIQQSEYDSKIRFIRSFKLYGSEEMKRNIDNFRVLHFSFINHGLHRENLIRPQVDFLQNHLTQKEISFCLDESALEIYDSSYDELEELLNNFDIIYATCSGSGAIIRPNPYNLPERDFGFTINEDDIDTLPIIGVIDTGVSNQTPLTPLLINPGEEYDLTGTGLFFDHTDHGTGVAAFAALGNRLIPEYRGEVESDARILPIKVLDSSEFPISQKKIIETIKKAYEEYGVKIFTLTIGYGKFPLNDNEEISAYANALDELTSELDILIFIATTNNCHNITDESSYPGKLFDTDSNLAPPADSMNNITVGACADNFEEGGFFRRSLLPDFPAIYSRKSHYNFSDNTIFNNINRNRHLLKPDILMPGGDYEQTFYQGIKIFDPSCDAALRVLSSDLNVCTYKGLGTSFAAPLAANYAAKLLKLYPDLDMQTIKALIINSAQRPKLGEPFGGFPKTMVNRITGHGIPNKSELLYSDNNQVTIVLKDVIDSGYIKIYSLHIPEYLSHAQRNRTLLTFTTTLCFKFKPKTNNQLLYCPVHIGYAICKNLPLESEAKGVQVINGKGSNDIGINSSCKWSQDFYYKSKMVSNVQKTSFNVSKTNITEESNTFKLVINAEFHKLLTEADKNEYNQEIPFALVINIRQNPLKNEELNDLYEELKVVNTIEPIIEIRELEAEL